MGRKNGKGRDEKEREVGRGERDMGWEGIFRPD